MERYSLKENKRMGGKEFGVIEVCKTSSVFKK